MARKAISKKLRWTIFARDGFCCRYCGRQAGTDGVDLAVDHMVSVKEGGDNSVDNLLTACQDCNGGKGARSLVDVPVPEKVLARINQSKARASEAAEAIRQDLEAQKERRQVIINVICNALNIERFTLGNAGIDKIGLLIQEFGVDTVSSWLQGCEYRDVEWHCRPAYLIGCARNHRKENGGA